MPRKSSSDLWEILDQEEIRPSRRPRTEHVRSMTATEHQPARAWSHEDIVAHRLACRNRTSDQLRMSIESHLDDYFEKSTKNEWATVLKRVSISLAHGIYKLKPEMFPKLQPDIYPYDDESDRIFVVEEVERYRLAPHPQGSNQKASRKRPIIPGSEDEDEAEHKEKKAKVTSNTNTPQEPTTDILTSQTHLAPPSSPHPASNTTQTEVTAYNSTPISQVSSRYENNSEPDIGTYVEDLLKSTFIQEIKALKEVNHSLVKDLLEVEKLKAAVVKFQRQASVEKAARRLLFQQSWNKWREEHAFIKEKDQVIKQLRAFNAKQHRRIINLEIDLTKEDVAHGTAVQGLQHQQQQELSEKDQQIHNLRSRLLEMSNAENQRLILGQRLVVMEHQLMAARVREQTYLEEDEKRVHGRRAAMQWGIAGYRR